MALLDRSRIVRQIFGYNPWWTGRAWDAPTFERLAVSRCLARLIDTTTRRAVLLSGPRRVGKSTVLRQVAKRLIQGGAAPKAVFYLSLDDNILKMVSLAELLELYREEVLPVSETCYLLLDEVQYARDWDLEVKRLIDHHPTYRVLATGSAAVEHRGRIADSGVGRWITIPIPTLSFFEFLHMRGETPSGMPEGMRVSGLLRGTSADRAAVAAAMRPTLPSFRRYLLVGGFPETALREDIADNQRLIREDIVDRVLKRDMTSLFGIRRVPEMERLFVYLCLHSGGLMNVSATAGQVGLPRPTVDEYLDYLVQANLIYRLEPYELGGKKRLKPKYRYYLVDAAIRNAVLLSGEEVLTNPAEMGLVVETAVLRHLYAFYYKDMPRVAYWRDPRTDHEVDIVLSSPTYTVPVEVKYESGAGSSIPQGLKRFLDAERATFAIVATQADTDIRVVSAGEGRADVLMVPAHILTYLLGSTERR